MKKTSIACFGELIVDMISINTGNLIASQGFLKKFGGAPGNTACGIASLGGNVNFIGKVGDDPFGHFLETTLREYGVGTQRLVLSKTDKTTLAFVSLDDKGQRYFTFYRGAHENIHEEEVSLSLDTTIFHFGSLTQVLPHARLATQKLIRQAEELGATISYDPNFRPSLWDDPNDAKEIILETAKHAHVMKVNEEEAKLLTGKSNEIEAAKILFKDNLEALFITLGERGCYYKTPHFDGHVRAPKVRAVDTTGAGDAFNAGFLFGLSESKKRVKDLSQEELEMILKKAVVIAALVATKKGAITAFPTELKIKQMLGRLN